VKPVFSGSQFTPVGFGPSLDARLAGHPRGRLWQRWRALRPVPGRASHRMPVAGLDQTGATTRPGGSIIGAPGRNAAIVLLHDLGHDPAGVMSTLPAPTVRGGHIQPDRLTGPPPAVALTALRPPGADRPAPPGVQPSRGRQPGSRITARDK
jgi:hypothetical protein